MSSHVYGLGYSRVPTNPESHHHDRDHATRPSQEDRVSDDELETSKDGDLSEAVAYIESATSKAFDGHARNLSLEHPHDRLSLNGPSSLASAEYNGSTKAGTTHTSSALLSQDPNGCPEKKSLAGLGPRPRMWNSPWLHHSVLITFAGVYAAMLVAVVVLYDISARNSGLGKQEESRHYAWTYGPTAFLTIVISLWRNFDFASRQLTPWQELRHGPSTASRTLLLDYISPTLPEYLWSAMRSQHWAVVASTLGVLLLKLTESESLFRTKTHLTDIQTVLSTGLIVLEPTIVSTDSNPFSLTSTFNVADFLMDNVTGTPGNVVYGITTQHLPYSKGTGPNLVVRDFQPQVPLPLDSIYSAEVDGFETDLECEILHIDNSTVEKTSLPWFSVLSPFFVANVTSGNCSIERAILAEAADHSYHHDPYATQNFQGRITNVTCSDGVDNSMASNYRPDHTFTFPDQRILMTVADLRWIMPADLVGQSVQTQDSVWWVQNVTGVLCRPSYTLGKYHVEYPMTTNTSGDPVNAVRSSNETSPFPGLNVAQINSAVLASMDRMYIGAGGADYVLATNVQNFFQILSVANNNSRQEAFMDPNLLQNLGSTIWKGVTSQLAHDYFMTPSHDVVVGSVSHTENRLQVKLLSTILMAISLGVLCLITMLLLVTRPHNVVPCEPTSIAALAAILTASPDVRRLGSGLGARQMSGISQALKGYSFLSRSPPATGTAFSVQTSEEKCVEEVSTKSSAGSQIPKNLWWRPLSTQRWFLCLTIMLPVSIIIVLEILQRVSDSHRGLAAATPSGTVNSRVLSSYLPAVIMLIVAALFSSIRNTAAVFSPYARLKRGNVPVSGIATDLVGKMSLHALLISAKTLDIGTMISIAAVLVATFLTIIVSGLYTVAEVSASANVTLSQIDRFDFAQGTLSIFDNDAGAITSLIEWSGLSYPDWTWGDLAFNHYGILGSVPNTGVISIDIPAFRARLDCDVPMSNTYSVEPRTDSTYEEYSDMTSIVVVRELPIPCLHMETNTTSASWQQHFYVPSDYSPNYVGQASLLRWVAPGSAGNETALTGDGGVYADDSGIYQVPAQDLLVGGYSCPSLGITIGPAVLVNQTEGNTTRILTNTSLTFAMCFQKLERVQTRVTLNLPDLSINTTLPPVPDESSAVIINNTALSSDVWEWPVNNFLTSLTNGSLKSTTVVPAPAGGDPGLNNLDPFLVTLIAGKDGVSVTDITGNTETGHSHLISASQRLYSIYMAQAFSANMRNTTALANTTLTGEVIDIPRWRLKQNRSPKIALQAILGFLAASAIVAWSLLDMREVLPHNPCSIAGVATLLTDSEFTTRRVFPEGAEWVSNGVLESRGVFEGLRLYLGWERGHEGEDDDGKFGIFLEP